MVSIELKYNNAYKWNNIGEVYSIGYLFYNNKLYKDVELTELISNLNESEMESFAEKVDGCFALVINFQNKILIISDLLRTFPVFYNISNDNIVIKDNIMEYKNRELDDNNVRELSYCNYVTGNFTLFKNIYQLEGHQIVEIDKNSYTVKKQKYFKYEYNFELKDDNIVIQELNKLYDNIAKKMIKYLDGRQAVIPLSGGNDSRLIAYYLIKNGYKNIIAYTYGNKRNSEIEISKKVADFLDIEWHFVEYKNKNMQKKFNNKKTYEEMANYCGRGYSSPIVQEWEAISTLLQEKIITKDSVVLPGYSGDFLAGTHIFDDLYNETKIECEKLLYSIYRHQYQYSELTQYNNNIYTKIKQCLNISNEEVFGNNKAIELFERFDFEERQTKYITNAIRTFDYQGLQWYLPFWDKDLISKWLSIPLEKRHNIELFNKFTKTIYPDLMEYAPIYKNTAKKEIKPPFKAMKKVYRVYEIYKKGFLNLYGYLHFRTYLKYFIKTKSYKYNKMFSSYYLDYLRKEIKKENKV